VARYLQILTDRLKQFASARILQRFGCNILKYAGVNYADRMISLSSH